MYHVQVRGVSYDGETHYDWFSKLSTTDHHAASNQALRFHALGFEVRMGSEEQLNDPNIEWVNFEETGYYEPRVREAA